MRFLRWYGRLTKQTLFKGPGELSLKGQTLRFRDLLVWYLTTSGLCIIFVVFGFLLPEPVRVLIVNTASICWTYILISVSAISDFAKPLTGWLNSVNWTQVVLNIKSFMYGFSRVVLHLIICMLTFQLAMIFILVFVDFLRTRLCTGLEKQHRPIMIICVLISALAGYYVTTSHISLISVSYISSLMVN